MTRAYVWLTLNLALSKSSESADLKPISWAPAGPKSTEPKLQRRMAQVREVLYESLNLCPWLALSDQDRAMFVSKVRLRHVYGFKLRDGKRYLEPSIWMELSSRTWNGMFWSIVDLFEILRNDDEAELWLKAFAS